MNDVKPISWPTREEWAKDQRTCYDDHLDNLRTDQRLSSYASQEEIVILIKDLRALWKKLGSQMRALAVPKELKRQPGELRLDCYHRQLAMAPDQQKLLEAEDRCIEKRLCINAALKDMRNDVVPAFWNTRDEEIKAILEPVLARYKAAHEKDIEELERKIAATPVDDAAWEKELARRASCEMYFSNGPLMINH